MSLIPTRGLPSCNVERKTLTTLFHFLDNDIFNINKVSVKRKFLSLLRNSCKIQLCNRHRTGEHFQARTLIKYVASKVALEKFGSIGNIFHRHFSAIIL